MSLKYQRVKEADKALPAPLRWLTRAFSSITLAVTLLSLVALYGMIASVPVAFLARGGLYALSVVIGVGGGVLLGRALLRRGQVGGAGCVALVGMGASAAACIAIAHWASGEPWFYANRAEVIYRLPAFEMTEIQFYGWWPLKVILGLFVLNLIWATIRRIEFKFANLGVLTVHTGIITVALGSIYYSRAKVEGDMLVWRHDLRGGPSREFYDATTAAIYFTVGDRNLMIPLPNLPRYNDYADGRPRPLDIRLDGVPEFAQFLGPHLHASIRGFISYGELVPTWVDAATTDQHPLFDRPNPAIRLEPGDQKSPDGQFSQLLVSGVPALRVIEEPSWAVEYLDAPDPQRLSDLMAEFDGDNGLVVDIPAAGFRAIYAIQEGQTIRVGDTGYTIKVEAIGPYEMSFASRGYQGARDTRAMVQVTKGGTDAHSFRRIVMHRYPERSQDFAPGPAPAPGDGAGMGPLGKRTDPDPSIRLTYIDATKLQMRIISGLSPAGTTQPGTTDGALRLLARVPGHKPFLGLLPGNHFPLGSAGGKDRWMHITQRIANAVQVMEPTITPAEQRNPKDEGTFLHALLPVDLESDTPPGTAPGTTPGTGPGTGPGTASGGKPWHKRIWLAHLRYPDLPDDEHRPVDVELPGVGAAKVTFSRLRMTLPFAVELDDFEMQPFPGTDIPRDFIAHLMVQTLGDGESPPIIETGESHLNNPMIYDGIKLSQTGWDPGDASDPNLSARGPNGRYLDQQRYTILGVGNNRGIHVIFFGACLIVLGIPWAFYIKPLLAQREKRKIQRQLAGPGRAP